MARAILRRLLHMVVVLLAMTGGTFLLMRLSPVDPVALHFVAMGTPADPALAAQIRAELGLDDPLVVQYVRWLGGLFTGDMGYSIAFGSPVAVLMKEALPRTLELAALSSLMALAVTLPLGILAYRRHGSRVDEAIRIVSFLGISLPTFWVGLLFILIFSVKLRLIPVVATDDLRGMILPSAALALWLAGLYIRRIRSALLEEAGKNYVLGARTLGLSERTVLWKYIMPNALMTLLPMLGITMGNIMGGSAVIETIFGWRGMGQLMTTAILARDYQLMQAYVLWGAGVFVAANFVADVLTLWLDPRCLQAKGARQL
ncbi:ABC transporter permease [Selenomonas artemidis]|uniref:ABC transporter permease n=1 Tax=Selenomonas artemidis TaxID=671224 RepID=UPI00288AAE6F|nr:ABC transporter permease [Selenomonas artemidis]